MAKKSEHNPHLRLSQPLPKRRQLGQAQRGREGVRVRGRQDEGGLRGLLDGVVHLEVTLLLFRTLWLYRLPYFNRKFDFTLLCTKTRV